jgi:hypothetical protein
VEEKITNRICRVCGELKVLSEFHRDKQSKDGRRAVCKKCRIEYVKQYQKENRERILEGKRLFYKENRERLINQSRRYKDCHKEEGAARDKRYYWSHIEQKSARDKNYYETHKEQELTRRSNYYKTHREQILKRTKNYQHAHADQISKREKKYRQTERGSFRAREKSHRRRARERASKVDLTSEEWQRILKNQEDKCNLCGKRLCKSRPATMDHIIPLAKGGDLTFNNTQALCRSCNSRKGAKVMKSFIVSW